MAMRPIRALFALSVLASSCVLTGCAGPYLLREDPSALPKYERAGLAWYLQRAIQDGDGRRRKTPWGENYFEYYLKLIRTEGPTGVPNAVLHLGSHGTLDGRKYWHLAEAFVQEGYGQAACEAIVGTARRWEKAAQSGRSVDRANLLLAYEIILELKFRMYLHEHRGLAAELHAAHGGVIVKKELMIASMEGFHIDRVDGRAVQQALIPKLLAARDGVFAEAHDQLTKLRQPAQPRER